MTEEAILGTFRDYITKEDYKASATCQSLEHLVPIANEIKKQPKDINTILDLGCGYGGLTAAFADVLDCEKVYGIDVDEDRRAVAEERGVTTYDLDLESENFPFDDGSVDLVLSFGVLEHLKYYDHPIEESNRVLCDGGKILYSVPNLGSWVNRIALIFGNQPRDVEISRHRAFGISGFYDDNKFLNHVHAPTYSAFLELLEYHGYNINTTVGLFPYQNRFFVKLFDKLTSPYPSLCRRIAVLGTKNDSV